MRSSKIAGKMGAFGAGFFGALWVGGATGTLVYKLASLLVAGKWPNVPLADIFPALAALSPAVPDFPELTPAVFWLARTDLLTAFAVLPLVFLLACLTLVERPGDFFSGRTKPRTINETWNQPSPMFSPPRPGGPGRGQDNIAPDKVRPAS